MSLPTNVKLSVLGHSRPGDPTNSVPKQAMIVRMSAETLDALQANPHMQFTFGSAPGIKIGETFFRMRPVKENSPHDLYLRQASAAKPMAPLKLYANITGKFTVERDLVNIQDGIRTSTRDAEIARSQRTTIMLDKPPSDISSAQTGKKRKAPGVSVGKSFPQPRPSMSTRAPSPLPPASLPPPARTAVIKALALKERSADELLPLVPGDDPIDRRRRALLDLLKQLAEPNAKDSSQWRLKPASWVYVRPYEWNDLTEQQRMAMARTARLTFGNLKIPTTDPVWDYVHYRETPESVLLAASATSSKASASVKPEKRGISSKEAKEKKAKPKAESKGQVLMRDETKPGPSNSRPTKPKETVDGPSPSTTSTAPRKVPGSGFRVSKVSGSDSQNPSPSPVPIASSSSSSSAAPRGKPVDVRMKDREPPRASLPAKPAPPIPPPAQDKKAVPPRIKKKDAGLEGEQGGNADGLKRKKPSHDIETETGLVAKRRKTDGGAPVRDLSLPKKPEVVESRSVPPKAAKPDTAPPPRQPQKSRSESTSLPPPRTSLSARPVASSASSSTNRTQLETHTSSKNPSTTAHSSSSSGSKRRERRSPIYTSSEDEGEIPHARKIKEPAPLPTPAATTALHSSRPRGQQSSSGSSRPLPTDRAGLRARYNTTYLKYLASYQQLFAQQTKLESLLKGGGDGTVSDSDGEVEVLSPEETMKLKADHKRWERELENIRDLFESV